MKDSALLLLLLVTGFELLVRLPPNLQQTLRGDQGDVQTLKV
jgi:hypothetical protein